MENLTTTPVRPGIGIGDVAKLCQVPPYTIRYWEKEFARFLSPRRTPGKQRRYTTSEIQKLLEIKKLLWENRFSIEGARMLLGGELSFPLMHN